MSFDPAIRTYYERHPSIPSNTPPPSITAAIHQHHQVTSPLANTTTATAAAVEEEEDFEDDEDDDEFYEDDDDYEEEEEGDNPFGDVALTHAKHLNSTSPPVGIADTTSGFHPSSYPTSMTVTIESVNLPSRQSDRPVLYRVVFRGRRARIRLSDLDAVSGSLSVPSPSNPRKQANEAHKKPSSIGHITISVDFFPAPSRKMRTTVSFPDDSASVIGDFDDEPQFGTRVTSIEQAFFNHGWPITKLDSRELSSLWRNGNPGINPNIELMMLSLTRDVFVWPRIVEIHGGDVWDCCDEFFGSWERFSGVEAFKPKFFVAWDEKTRAVVVSIRGTLNIHEVVTDMCAEYEPHRTGFAHRGMLRCALWLEHHLIPLLIPHLRDRRARALYLVGHSLGGSIAALLTMLIRDNEALMGELRTLKGFRLHSFGFGSPPCVSGELADGLAGWVDSYTNENDTVPRLSYGSLCDFRDLVIKAAELQKTKLSELDRFTALTTHQTHLHTSNLSPKVYVPGTVHYIYKTSRVLKKTTHVPTSGVKAVDDERPHYVLERSDRHRFLDVQVKLDMLWDHIPSRYENGLKKAHDWLLEHHVEDGEPDTPLSAPVTSKGFLGMFGRRHKNSQHASTM
ncbi:hypothetical protein BC829DRAFT_432095 [Chytridium lagenaria]|nr:hypothetical protein BC829DRAFT_432095 [Chytridium lagenaria]